jgi:hypothetical protein
MDGYVSKPLEPKELFKAIGEATARPAVAHEVRP